VGATIDDFRALDTEPYGINPDSAESHRDFIDKLKLPFDLLVDENLDVATVYGAVRPEGDKNARTVIMVGKDGVVFYRAAGAPDPSELLQAIREAQD
jgi:peroxiredoxin Q/BCP